MKTETTTGRAKAFFGQPEIVTQGCADEKENEDGERERKLLVPLYPVASDHFVAPMEFSDS